MEELESKLLDVQHILKNKLTKKIILDYLKDNMDYDYDDVERSIKSYLNNLETIDDAIDEVAYKTKNRLIKHLTHFIENTKDETKISLYHMALLNDMNFFIGNSFNKINKVKIQEIADEAGASNTVLIEKAKELGYDVKVAMDTVTVEQYNVPSKNNQIKKKIYS